LEKITNLAVEID